MLVLSSCSALLQTDATKNAQIVKMYDLNRASPDDCLFDNSNYAREVTRPNLFELALNSVARNDRIGAVSDAYYRTLKKLNAKYPFLSRQIAPERSLNYLRELHKQYSYLPILLPLFKPFLSSKFYEYRKTRSRKAYYHKGIDLIGRHRADIYAAGDGTVVFSGNQRGYGKLIMIQHSKDIKTLYAHLSSLQVKNGQQVSRGQIIGRQGASGNASGEHLHFEVLIKNKPVEPLDFIGAFCRIKPRA